VAPAAFLFARTPSSREPAFSYCWGRASFVLRLASRPSELGGALPSWCSGRLAATAWPATLLRELEPTCSSKRWHPAPASAPCRPCRPAAAHWLLQFRHVAGSVAATRTPKPGGRRVENQLLARWPGARPARRRNKRESHPLEPLPRAMGGDRKRARGGPQSLLTERLQRSGGRAAGICRRLASDPPPGGRRTCCCWRAFWKGGCGNWRRRAYPASGSGQPQTWPGGTGAGRRWRLPATRLRGGSTGDFTLRQRTAEGGSGQAIPGRLASASGLLHQEGGSGPHIPGDGALFALQGAQPRSARAIC